MAKEILKNKFALVDALLALGEGVRRGPEMPHSYMVMRKLVKAGFIKYERDGVKEHKRGATPKMYRVSGKGKGYLALAKNWKRNTETA